MNKFTVRQLSFLAFSASVNIIGGFLALSLRLPIYLDTAGTMLAAALLGPFYGMIPGLISGLVCGVTGDLYAFYYIPVQLITGLLAGIVFQKKLPRGFRLLPAAAFISLPGTIISSFITAAVFGGITSSGSTFFVQLFHGLGLNLTASVCVVQVFTDYADRLAAIAAAVVLFSLLPSSLKAVLKGKGRGTGRNEKFGQKLPARQDGQNYRPYSRPEGNGDGTV